MNIFPLNEKSITENALMAKQLLANGGIIIYPTSTLYGLGATLSNTDALYRINLIKEREKYSPQIMLIRFEWIERYIEDSERFMPLMEILWPGPYSILLPPRFKSPFKPSGLIAFRVSPHPFVDTLLEYLDEPLSSTSVNKAGEAPITKRKTLVNNFSDDIEGIVYDDESKYLPYWDASKMKQLISPSTLIDASDFPEKINILRVGESDLSSLNNIFPELTVNRSYE